MYIAMYKMQRTIWLLAFKRHLFARYIGIFVKGLTKAAPKITRAKGKNINNSPVIKNISAPINNPEKINNKDVNMANVAAPIGVILRWATSIASCSCEYFNGGGLI